MPGRQTSSEYRFEKRRVEATVTLSSGQSTRGSFFASTQSARYDGAERIGDLLNDDAGFFPFEVQQSVGARTLLFNRAHVVLVALTDDEHRRDSGYEVATRRHVSMLLTTGQRVSGYVRVYRPEGRDRLSDWTRQPETFRYLETGDAALLVNAAHIVDISEVPEP